MVAPLTALTKGGGIKINWGSEAAGAFEELKRRFTSASHSLDPRPRKTFRGGGGRLGGGRRGHPVTKG